MNLQQSAGQHQHACRGKQDAYLAAYLHFMRQMAWSVYTIGLDRSVLSKRLSDSRFCLLSASILNTAIAHTAANEATAPNKPHGDFGFRDFLF